MTSDRQSPSQLLRRALIWCCKLPVHAYRYVVSPLIGPCCRFQPTCSAYALEAFDKHGPLVGLWLTVRRIGRCHPLGGSGYDPVPDKAPPLFTRPHRTTG